MQKRWKALKRYLDDEEEVILAYLFGSQVEGTVGPKSDYDVGVLVHSPSLPLWARLSHEIGVALDTSQVDVVLLNWAPVELAYAIIAQGRLLYQRSLADRVEFEARVLGLYGDYLPTLRQQRREILEGKSYEAGVRRYRETIRRTERTLAAIRAAARPADR